VFGLVIVMLGILPVVESEVETDDKVQYEWYTNSGEVLTIRIAKLRENTCHHTSLGKGQNGGRNLNSPRGRFFTTSEPISKTHK
jgi:hypothetical protein